MKAVTIPPFPWDAVAEKVISEAAPVVEPQKSYMGRLIRDTMRGKVDERDMEYMAKAILQMSDEIFELRERIRAMEMAVADGARNRKEDCRPGGQKP
ncbi:MAG: hypothetical protein EBT13_15720 [Rhodobacteraceae bacterium]|nr:hypothetical protein [Paracoccaceae bacterium]